MGLAAHGHLLLVAHHGGNPSWEAAAGGGQRLAFSLFDAARQACAAAGPLPLTPGAALAWLGFSEEGLPATYDSAGALRLRTGEWGGAWAPVFNSKAARSGERARARGLQGRAAQLKPACAPPAPLPWHDVHRPPPTRPPFHAGPRAEGGSEVFWPVAISCRELTCVVTSDAAPHPPTDPRPVLAMKPLQARAGGAGGPGVRRAALARSHSVFALAAAR